MRLIINFEPLEDNFSYEEINKRMVQGFIYSFEKYYVVWKLFDRR